MDLWFKLLKGKIERGTKDSAAFDVFFAGPKPIYVGDAPLLLKTGIFTEFDPRLVAILKERSGLGLKGLEVKAGVIDADYRKEWGVVARFPIQYTTYDLDDMGNLIESSKQIRVREDYTPFLVKPGDKIAQFLLVEKPKVAITLGDGAEFVCESIIRDGGFGSTDRKQS